jgi:hypothetical protein
MPLNYKLVDTAVNNYLVSIRRDLKFNKELIISENTKLVYFRECLLAHKDELYTNDLIIELLKCSPDKIIITKATYNQFKNFEVGEEDHNSKILSKNNMGIIFKQALNKDIVIVYIRGLLQAYKNKYEANIKVQLLSQILLIPKYTLNYILRRYYLQIQFKLLLGHSHLMCNSSTRLRIIGKHRKKASHEFAIIKKTEDWGESFKFLIEQSKTLDITSYIQYLNKQITKKEFINKLRPHLYSTSNPNGLKWIIYSNKEFDYWLVASKENSEFSYVEGYNITPTNFINCKHKSQIQFTNNCTDVSQIIYSEELGLRDKIRALERFDIEYCKKTFPMRN